MNMTYGEALVYHVRQFDDQVEILREILILPNYDNGESSEVINLKKGIAKAADNVFKLKQCFSEAESLAINRRKTTK